MLQQHDINDTPHLDRLTLAPVATAAQSRLLARRARAGDNAAHMELVARNTRLVFGVLRDKYSQIPVRSGGLDRADLVQEGLIGLSAAARAYDPANRAAFSSFAYIAIQREMARAVQTQHNLVYRPKLVFNAHRAMAAASAAIAEREGRPASINEIADAANVEPDDVVVWLEFPEALTSLDAPLEEDSETARHESTAAVVTDFKDRRTAMTADDVEILSARVKPKHLRSSLASLAESFGVTPHEMARRERAAMRRAEMGELPTADNPEIAAGLMRMRPRDWSYLIRHYEGGETSEAIAADFKISRSEVSRRTRDALEDWSALNPGRSVRDAEAEAKALWAEGAEVLERITGRAGEVARLTWGEWLDRSEVVDRLEIPLDDVIRAETAAAAEIYTRVALKETSGWDFASAVEDDAAHLRRLGPMLDRETLGVTPVAWELTRAVHTGKQPTAAVGRELGLSPFQAKNAYTKAAAVIDDWIAEHPGRDFEDFAAARGATRATIGGLIDRLPDDEATALRVRELDGDTWSHAGEAIGRSIPAVQRAYERGLGSIDRLVVAGADRHLQGSREVSQRSAAA